MTTDLTRSAAQGKVVLVTGASSGIGEATARHLAAGGHKVLLGARRVDRIAVIAKEILQAGGEAGFHELDVTSLDSVQAFTAAAINRYGRIDVLVNNAGVMPLSMLEELRISEWNQMIDVNLRGVLHGIAAVLPLMKEQKVGHIVNIASTSAYRVDPTAAVYCATKFAVRALSEGLRQENTDIRVTVVSPGLTRSELVDGITSPQVQAAVRQMMDQAIAPEAIAQAIGFAIGQPADVDVSELIVRPTAQR
ncbi:short chain dehydrogenase family protein [Collimonas fungivorans]|uniref:Short chain dehydrogenase family protein n=1 Tax=Collimonas fungivorans TaxID=158899 RepID=A0A127P6L8_9BURK|nr:SDR family oxidoreductase [Collimonas fungivorans]AMO93081.1 short chain dehydrogenase family protein [Collimonas fungivorans]